MTTTNADPAIATNLAAPYRIPESSGLTRHSAYTEVIGDGHFDVGVYLPVIDRTYVVPTMRSIRNARRSQALAAFTGATIEVGETDPTEWSIVAKGSATDFEESRSTYGSVALGLVNLISSYYGESIYIGVLLEARLHPLGVDPVSVGDSDTAPGWCVDCAEPHPFAAYMPPEREDLNALGTPLVLIKTAPHGWYAEQDRLLAEQTSARSSARDSA